VAPLHRVARRAIPRHCGQAHWGYLNPVGDDLNQRQIRTRTIRIPEILGIQYRLVWDLVGAADGDADGAVYYVRRGDHCPPGNKTARPVPVTRVRRLTPVGYDLYHPSGQRQPSQ
jgi:hypothetical protein